MIVDAHHHFWDPERRDYPWMAGLAAIRRRFEPEDMRPLLQANDIQHTVLVQTVSSNEETREFLATAAETDFVAGVVGWLDLTDAGVADQLAKLRKGSGGDRLIGIRHQVHDEADPDWLRREDVQRGLAAIEDAGLVYDLLVRTRELPAAHYAVSRHADLRFVIDHVAKPRIADGPRDAEWERAMAPMAALPNVTCKLSGLVTEAGWETWTQEKLEPYITRVLDWFGPERCMFGSDWPVCLLAASYEEVVETIRKVAGDDEDVFARTAMRVYGLTS
jgi:L-fucono-1,5-lactonase